MQPVLMARGTAPQRVVGARATRQPLPLDAIRCTDPDACCKVARVESRCLLLLVDSRLASPLDANLPAYLKLGTLAGRDREPQWENLPVRYFVTDAAGGGVSATQLARYRRSRVRCLDVGETASVAAEFAGFTKARPNDDDDMTVSDS